MTNLRVITNLKKKVITSFFFKAGSVPSMEPNVGLKI